MAAHMAMPPLAVISAAAWAIRRIFSFRSLRENPRSGENRFRAASPSNRKTGRWVDSNFACSMFAIVDWPDPGRPVKNTVKPMGGPGASLREITASNLQGGESEGKDNEPGNSPGIPCGIPGTAFVQFMAKQ